MSHTQGKGPPGRPRSLPSPPRIVFPRAGCLPAKADGEGVQAGEVLATRPDGLPVHSALTGRVRLEAEWLVVDGEVAEPVGLPAGPGGAREIARRAGLLGLGGGMFPTHRKLERPAEVVIVNGCQSEPYVTCDASVLEGDRAGVDCGLRLAMGAVGAQRGEIARGEGRYPDGYERYLAARVTGREVPPGGRPQDVGALVMNVQTVRALHQAVCLGRPLVDRVVTVAGGAVARPGNYLVPIGTEIDHLLRVSEVAPERVAALIAGGPMMGREVGPGQPVEAGTIAVLALTADEVRQPVEEDCIRCGECAEVCPEGLLPAALIERGSSAVLRCIECGACQVACSSGRPLLLWLRERKAERS